MTADPAATLEHLFATLVLAPSSVARAGDRDPVSARPEARVTGASRASGYHRPMFLFRRPSTMPTPDEALKGRPTPIVIDEPHHVNGAPLRAPWPDGTRTLVIGMGCFWGAEKAYWSVPGVISTAVGYAGGLHAQPDVRGGLHRSDRPHGGGAGRVRPVPVTDDELLRIFWEHHDPTQGMRQGNDVGTQYRSAIYWAR